jgi:hypothetical protein
MKMDLTKNKEQHLEREVLLKRKKLSKMTAA